MTIKRLEQLDVVVAHPAGMAPRVEIVDKRTLIEVVSLSPSEARLLAMRLVEWAEAARPPPLPGAERGQ